MNNADFEVTCVTATNNTDINNKRGEKLVYVGGKFKNEVNDDEKCIFEIGFNVKNPGEHELVKKFSVLEP